MHMRLPFALGIVVAACSVALPALAVPSQATVLADTQCRGCHGGGIGPSIAAANGGFAILDPANNQPVTAYVPGKTYRLRMRFQGRLLNGAYRNAYRLSVTAGQIVDNGQVGLVQGLLNARIVTTTDATVANTMDVSWVAPASGTVELGTFRIETNNGNNATGDFNSQAKEIILVSPVPVVTPPPVSDASAPAVPADAGVAPQSDASGPVRGADPDPDPEPDVSTSADATNPVATTPGEPADGCQMTNGVVGGKEMAPVALVVVFFFLGRKRDRRRQRDSIM